jgi:hypothetical protein
MATRAPLLMAHGLRDGGSGGEEVSDVRTFIEEMLFNILLT